MYSSENSGFDIKDIIVKILFLIFFAVILYWLYPKFPEIGNIDSLTDRVYHENITAMKEAAEDYYTTDRLPKNNGDMSEMTLQRMLDLKLIVPFVDKDGNSCDVNNSYVQVTKDGNEYVMKVTLVCGKQNDYIIEHIGCHDVCERCTVEDKKDEEKESTTKTSTNTTTKTTTKTTNTTKTTTTTTTKYTIKVKATNGVVADSTLTVKKGKNGTTVVRPAEGYAFSKVSCTNSQKATWKSNKFTVKSVSKSATCTVTFKKSTAADPGSTDKETDPVKTGDGEHLVKVAVVNGVANTNSKAVKDGNDTSFTFAANNGYDIYNRNVTCTSGTTSSMKENKLTISNVKKDTTCVVTFGKTNYTSYTVTIKVTGGKSDVDSRTVAPNSETAFTITPNDGYTLTGATVSCGNGLNGTLISKTVKVTNIKANGGCVVVLKKGSTATTANVVKTYYSTGYVYGTGSGKYAVNIETPNNIDPKDVIATGVDIQPMSSYSDFVAYANQKAAGTISQPNGESGWSVAKNTAALLQEHALTSKNFTVSANSGCTKTQCSVTISYNVTNTNGVTPTGEVTFVNGQTGKGLYYLPVKFIVTYKYTK